MSTDFDAADGKLIARYHDHFADIIINNPARRNALSFAMWSALPGVVNRIVTESDAKVIVLSGEGEHFAAGADISEFAETRSDLDKARAYEQSNADAFQALRQAPVPVVAAIRGFAMGGGAALALACDMRLASMDAVIAIPAARLGVGYPIDSLVDLVGIVGAAHARDMLYTGRRFSADEAQRIGLVTDVVPAASLAEALAQLTSTLASNAPLTIQAAKTTIAAISAGRFEQDRAALESATDRCFASADYREGFNAFLEKRQPVFRGT